NLLAGLLRHRSHGALRLRYEDFAAHPRHAVTSILHLLGEHPERLPFADDRRVVLGVAHTLHGNPNRFKTCEVQNRLEEDWQTRTGACGQAVVASLSWALLARYSYLSGGRRSDLARAPNR